MNTNVLAKATIAVAMLGPSLLSGCAGPKATVEPDTAISLPESLGQRVTLTGIAENWKLGALVRCDDMQVWIAGQHGWPADYSGQRVRVVGILEERHDLPVFIADTPEERMALAGIPVPSGTDLHEASRRYVIRDATWTLAR